MIILDPSKVRDAFYTRENEIKQIESLIPEIKEKIADTKDMKTETFKKLGDKRLMEEGIASAFGSAEAGSSNGEGKIFNIIEIRGEFWVAKWAIDYGVVSLVIY